MSKYQCPECKEQKFSISTTYWECYSCNTKFPCIDGIPFLYREKDLNQHDRKLRDKFYNGLMGIFYQFMMPLLVLPVRPIKISWKHWLFYFIFIAIIIFLIAKLMTEAYSFSSSSTVYLLLILGIIIFFQTHLYLLYLFLLAVPVKITTLFSSFQPDKSFNSIHEDLFSVLKNKKEAVEILDISTGSCNSLVRHGWLDLGANLTGLDLSEVMLKNGVKQITKKKQSMDFVFSEASELPFSSNFFDVTLNYGAVNGYANIEKALQEMLRVTKKGGLILLFDENLYQQASWLESIYFNKVLSSHDTIKHCPMEYLPEGLLNLKVYQPYQFYFLLTAIKA